VPWPFVLLIIGIGIATDGSLLDMGGLYNSNGIFSIIRAGF